jgi:hypothetical protein
VIQLGVLLDAAEVMQAGFEAVDGVPAGAAAGEAGDLATHVAMPGKTVRKPRLRPHQVLSRFASRPNDG